MVFDELDSEWKQWGIYRTDDLEEASDNARDLRQIHNESVHVVRLEVVLPLDQPEA